MHWVHRMRAELDELPAWVIDGALALALAVVGVSFLWVVDPDHHTAMGYEGPTLQAVGIVLLVSLPLTWRRRFPVEVFFVVGMAALLAAWASVPSLGWGVLIALYSVAVHASRFWSRAVLVAAVVGTVVALLLLEVPQYAGVDLVVTIAAWVLGDRQRTRRAYTRELELRARQLEREREDKARLAVVEERSRIARELHDIVAHSVSVMLVQATAARRRLAKDRAQAEEALGQVEATGRQSMIELRRLVGLLRSGDDDASFVPQPQLAQLEELVRQFRDAGMQVELEVEGPRRPLSSGIDLSAYRIVQEALTNALKHAGPTSARVLLRYGDGWLDVAVEDDGGRLAPAETAGTGAGAADNGRRGHGVVGMRERAALVGGEVMVGPREGGGYCVRARLPVEDR